MYQTFVLNMHSAHIISSPLLLYTEDNPVSGECLASCKRYTIICSSAILLALLLLPRFKSHTHTANMLYHNFRGDLCMYMFSTCRVAAFLQPSYPHIRFTITTILNFLGPTNISYTILKKCAKLE